MNNFNLTNRSNADVYNETSDLAGLKSVILHFQVSFLAFTIFAALLGRRKMFYIGGLIHKTIVAQERGIPTKICYKISTCMPFCFLYMIINEQWRSQDFSEGEHDRMPPAAPPVLNTLLHIFAAARDTHAHIIIRQLMWAGVDWLGVKCCVILMYLSHDFNEDGSNPSCT